VAEGLILVCTAGDLIGQRFEVPEGGLTIGRSSENEVVLGDEGVSRFHARILFENASLWVQDSGSRNGIFVNGNRVTGHRALKVGDQVLVAEHTFDVRWPDPDAERSGRFRAMSAKNTASPSRRWWFWPW